MTVRTFRSFYTSQNWNPGYGHKVKMQGRLVSVMVDGKEMCDVEASIARLAATADPAKAHMAEVNERQRAVHRGTPAPQQPAPHQPAVGAAQSPAGSATYMQAKTAQKVYEAKNEQLEYEERVGKLVKKEDVERASFNAARFLRDGLTNCSRRLGATVAVLTTPDECAAAIEREHRALLQSWAKTMGVATPALQDPAA